MLFEEMTYSASNVTYSNVGKTVSEGGVAYLGYKKTTTEKKLWDAFRQGCDVAYTEIYKNYSNMLFNYGCQFSNDQEMVRDCLHDFFVYLKKNRAGFGETTSIKMYLFKAFKRRVIDYLKKHVSEYKLSEMFALTQMPVELCSESAYISKEVKDEQLLRLNNAMKALDQKERKAIYYYYYQGLSYEQIAAIFKFSHVSSARRIMYRSLRLLRSHLA